MRILVFRILCTVFWILLHVETANKQSVREQLSIFISSYVSEWESATDDVSGYHVQQFLCVLVAGRRGKKIFIMVLQPHEDNKGTVNSLTPHWKKKKILIFELFYDRVWGLGQVLHVQEEFFQVSLKQMSLRLHVTIFPVWFWPARHKCSTGLYISSQHGLSQ